MSGLHGGFGLTNHPRRGSFGRVVRVYGGRIDLARHDDLIVRLARYHALVEEFAISPHIRLSLIIRSRGGCEIGDAEVVVLLRRFHNLLNHSQIGRGVLDCDLIVPRIDLDQQLARPHSIVVLGVDPDDSAVDARAEWIDVAVYLRVIGGFVRLQVVPCERRHRTNGEDQQHQQYNSFGYATVPSSSTRRTSHPKRRTFAQAHQATLSGGREFRRNLCSGLPVDRSNRCARADFPRCLADRD